MAEAFIDANVQLAFVSQRVGKTIPQVSLFAFFIGFSLATGSLAETAAVAPKKTIVFLGDSITAGYGLAKGDAYPALIQKKIEEAGLPYEVENAGLSGDTTAGALRRIDWLLQRPIHVLVIELGGNDGLRGLPPGVTEANLQSIIDKVRARSPLTRIMIAGMRIPPNLGADYTGEFEQIFSDLATKNGAVLVPFLLEGVGGNRGLNQPDQIHPTAAGQKIIAETVWKRLQPLLQTK
jgi:acyl-CoA thioesterase I